MHYSSVFWLQRLIILDFFQEIDYTKEAANAELFASNFKKMDYIKVPRINWEYTTPQVLISLSTWTLFFLIKTPFLKLCWPLAPLFIHLNVGSDNGVCPRDQNKQNPSFRSTGCWSQKVKIIYCYKAWWNHINMLPLTLVLSMLLLVWFSIVKSSSLSCSVDWADMQLNRIWNKFYLMDSSMLTLWVYCHFQFLLVIEIFSI